MQVGISTASFFTRHQTEDALAIIAGIGASRYEAFLSGYEEYEPAFIRELLSRQRDLGLFCTAVHTLGSQFEPQLFSMVERQRRGAEVYFRKALEGAVMLGAPLYVMHGIFHLKANSWAPNHERIGERFVALCKLAESFGVRLTLENVHWCMYAQSGLAALLEPHLGGCSLGYTLDVKQAVQSGDAIEDYFFDMGKRLCNIHLCDVVRRNNEVHTCLPGQGEVDFERLCTMAAAQSPEASVTLEVYSPDYETIAELRQSYLYLKGLFSKPNRGGQNDGNA
jgi:sugar phosphate isomerase/epimerase